VSKFRVVVYREAAQFMDLLVDAESQEEAERKASEIAKHRTASDARTARKGDWQTHHELNEGAYTFNTDAPGS
jgi:hypothetical protein